MESSIVPLLSTGAIYLLLVIGLIQPSAPRMIAAFTFTLFALAHVLISPLLTDFVYYAVAAIFDLMVMFVISAAVQVSRAVLSIHKICLTSIVFNGIGCLLWYNYISPVYYNIAFFILYLWAIKTLLQKDSRYDVRGFTADSWRLTFRYNYNTWFKCVFARKEKA